jgi:hypothetical protein
MPGSTSSKAVRGGRWRSPDSGRRGPADLATVLAATALLGAAQAVAGSAGGRMAWWRHSLSRLWMPDSSFHSASPARSLRRRNRRAPQLPDRPAPLAHPGGGAYGGVLVAGGGVHRTRRHSALGHLSPVGRRRCLTGRPTQASQARNHCSVKPGRSTRTVLRAGIPDKRTSHHDYTRAAR